MKGSGILRGELSSLIGHRFKPWILIISVIKKPASNHHDGPALPQTEIVPIRPRSTEEASGPATSSWTSVSDTNQETEGALPATGVQSALPAVHLRHRRGPEEVQRVRALPVLHCLHSLVLRDQRTAVSTLHKASQAYLKGLKVSPS